MSNLCRNDNNSGKIFLSSEYTALFNRDNIEITLNEDYDNKEYHFYLDNIPDNLPFKLSCNKSEFNDGLIFNPSPNYAYFDESILETQITLRRWKEGDKISPFGMKGNKKLSDLFTDMKLSINDKNKVWLLEVNGTIVWVIRYRTSNNYKCVRGKDIVILSFSE